MMTTMMMMMMTMINGRNMSYTGLLAILTKSIAILNTNINPLPHGDANRHTIFKRKN